jgi:tetratricopeptide (TPR) repeat protein
MELMNNPFLKIEGGRYIPFTASEKLATIIFTLGKYVQLLVFPHPLTHDYYPRHIDLMQFSNWKVLLSFLVYALLTFFSVKGILKKKVWAYGILFYLITLSIVSNIVFPIGTNMSERFMYMPSLGYAIGIAALAVYLINRFSQKPIYLLAGLLITGLSIRTVTRNFVWKDNYTLFTTDINTSKRSAKLLNAVGGELVTQASKREESPERQKMLLEGVSYLEKATGIHPNYKLSYLLLGNGNYYLKNYEAAIGNYQQVLRLKPDDTDGIKNLGIAYRDAGRYFGQEIGDLNKAVGYLIQATQLIPDDYEAVHLLGVSYGMQGNSTKAVEYFTKGTQLAPNNATAYFNLGLAYNNLGNAEKARENYDKALAIDPDIVNNRGN